MITAPYGQWLSPITTEWVTLGQKKFGNIVIDRETIYWDELRPSEGGRSVIVKSLPDGTTQEVSPPQLSVRSRVHEYGGAPFTVQDGKVYFVSDKDQRIYTGETPLTEPGIRFADLQIYGSYLIAVAEKGHDNFLACLNLKTHQLTKLAEGHDFYASPVFFQDQIAFLTWDHPRMPWDGTELWLANFKEGALSNLKKIAGGESESIFQPAWSPEGVLHFVSDKTGWWNIYRFENETIPVCSGPREYGLPQWVFGMSTYAFAGNRLISAFLQEGRWQIEGFDLPWTYYSQIRATPHFAVFIAASPTQDRCIVKLDIKTGKTSILAHNAHPHLDPGYCSLPQFIKCAHTHAFYYPPSNPKYQAPPDTLPPLLVMTHGGPTAATSSTFDLKIQYWTSRGIAVLDVDYRGSTGYGRPYREALKGEWGIVDVQDCEEAARFLIKEKKVDPKKIAIRGGSAGGYTTLAALTFSSLFSAGASYYGISDLTALAEETHKFESRYLDSLIGPYPASKDLYEARSPLFHVDQLRCPVIFFQGSEDLVVPLSQAEKMYQALKDRNIPTELVVYEGEQHGFRQAHHIRDALEKELAFYLKIWHE